MKTEERNGKKFLLFAIMALIHSIAFGQPKQHQKNALLEEAKKAIATSNAIYFTSYAKNDGSILNHYAEDACLLGPNAPIMCGREAAAKFFKEAYETYGVRGGKFITVNVYGDGHEYVTEEGLYQSFDANGKLFDEGKFLVLWKKTKDGWKMFRDSFSSNRAIDVDKK